MLRRKAYDKLLSWKNQSEKKALCVIGARQIGKTTLIREFGKKNYKHFVEINFILDKNAKAIFDKELDVKTIITNFTAYAQKQMPPHETLIFFDEIQACPNARTAIKFLVEDGRFDYIESGSLLGTKYQEVPSYPVGFEEIYYMYPLDFEEYLWANDVQPQTIDYLKKSFDSLTPVTDTVHSTLSKLFYSYIVVGGMPAVVQNFVKTHDITNVVSNQRSILELYRLDIAQYAERSDQPKIKGIFDSIPSQLDEKNRRFILTKLDEHGRQNRYQNSFLWLSDAGVALPCFNVSQPQPPLQLNQKHNLFKLYMGDTGLLCAACMENVQFAILQGDLSINMGSILENVIAQVIKCNGFNLNYYDSKKHGEIDFVIQNGTHVDLIEVKSGNDYKQHSALNKVLKVDEWKFKSAYVFCKGNIETTESVVYLPWYMIMFYKPQVLQENFIYEIDLSGLNV